MQAFEFNVCYDPATQILYIVDPEEGHRIRYFAEDEEMIFSCLKDYIENFVDPDRAL